MSSSITAPAAVVNNTVVQSGPPLKEYPYPRAILQAASKPGKSRERYVHWNPRCLIGDPRADPVARAIQQQIPTVQMKSSFAPRSILGRPSLEKTAIHTAFGIGTSHGM